MFKKVTLDQNIPDIMNEKEMSAILTPKKDGSELLNLLCYFISNDQSGIKR